MKTISGVKAIPALVAGIAFFLIGCQYKIPIKAEVKMDESSLALHQIAETHLKAQKYREALTFLARIRDNHSDYEGLAVVEYQIAECHYFLGDYKNSSDLAVNWLKKYPLHPARKDLMSLLGENFAALEDKPHAFYWYLEAKKEFFDDPAVHNQLDVRLEDLIAQSGIEDLNQMAVYAAGTPYAPMVHFRQASIFLERDELGKARDVALSMLQDPQHPTWSPAGMELLTKIEEEMSVHTGLVGCLLPLSGPFEIYGQEVLKGIHLAIFNDSEEGTGLELAIRDTKDIPEHALAALEELTHNEKVIAVIGPLSSKTAAPVSKRAQELGVPIITLTQKEGITKEGDMVFRNFLTPSREIKRVLDTSMIERGIRRFAILYPDNSYGRFFMNLFWDRIDEMGGIVTAVECYQPDQTDFAIQIKKMTGVYYPKPKSLIKKMVALRPPEEEEYKIYPEEPEPVIDFDAVFIPDNFFRIAMVAPQLAYHDVQDVLLIGTSLWQSPKLLEMAGDYVQGAIFPSGFFEKSRDPGVGPFIGAYEMNFSSTPGILAAAGYDTIKILKKIMQTQDIKTRKDLRDELLRLQGFKGVTGNISFDSQGEPMNEPFLLTVSGRNIQKVKTADP